MRGYVRGTSWGLFYRRPAHRKSELTLPSVFGISDHTRLGFLGADPEHEKMLTS